MDLVCDCDVIWLLETARGFRLEPLRLDLEGIVPPVCKQKLTILTTALKKLSAAILPNQQNTTQYN